VKSAATPRCRPPPRGSHRAGKCPQLSGRTPVTLPTLLVDHRRTPRRLITRRQPRRCALTSRKPSPLDSAHRRQPAQTAGSAAYHAAPLPSRVPACGAECDGAVRPPTRPYLRARSPKRERPQLSGKPSGDLAHAWHARCLADPIASHAFSHGYHPQHSQRLAAYWAEALGGPPDYTESLGDESSVVRLHSGSGEHQEMDERAQTCFAQALDDAGLPNDRRRLRSALKAYFRWVTEAMSPTPSRRTTFPTDGPSRGGPGTDRREPRRSVSTLAQPAPVPTTRPTCGQVRCPRTRELAEHATYP
jgi:hemoglobin